MTYVYDAEAVTAAIQPELEMLQTMVDAGNHHQRGDGPKRSGSSGKAGGCFASGDPSSCLEQNKEVQSKVGPFLIEADKELREVLATWGPLCFDDNGGG